MVNKTWMYNARLHKLLSFKVEDDVVVLVTDKEWLEIPLKKINKGLDNFLEAAGGNGHADVKMVLYGGNGNGNLKDLVFENINKIKADPSYINQAKAINEQVKTVIEMAKLQIKLNELD